MAVAAAILRTLIDQELSHLSDGRVIAHIRSLLVEPRVILRHWNYSDQRYPCWAVLDDRASGSGIAYCESGFGPRCPWGLVWLEGDENKMSMGDDSQWYPTFLQAYFESGAPGVVLAPPSHTTLSKGLAEIAKMHKFIFYTDINDLFLQDPVCSNLQKLQ